MPSTVNVELPKENPQLSQLPIAHDLGVVDITTRSTVASQHISVCSAVHLRWRCIRCCRVSGRGSRRLRARHGRHQYLAVAVQRATGAARPFGLAAQHCNLRHDSTDLWFQASRLLDETPHGVVRVRTPSLCYHRRARVQHPPRAHAHQPASLHDGEAFLCLVSTSEPRDEWACLERTHLAVRDQRCPHRLHRRLRPLPLVNEHCRGRHARQSDRRAREGRGGKRGGGARWVRR